MNDARFPHDQQEGAMDGLLREMLQAEPANGESSPRVVAAVMREIRSLAREAASPFNGLALLLALGTALVWGAARLLAMRLPGAANLVDVSFGHLVGDLVLWAARTAGQALLTLLTLGLGEVFPWLLLGLVLTAVFAARLPARSER